MTARDRTVLLVVAVLAVAGGSWFLLLSPVGKDAKAVTAQLVAAQARATAAQALVAQGEQAKFAYAKDYAAVSRLGKAVPADDDVPSLVVQLESAADRSRVDFRSIELGAGGAAAAAAAPAATPAPPVDAAAGGATGPTGAAGSPGAPAAGVGSVPATQAAAAVLPPGAVVGTAGFPTLPFDLAFTGSFFRLQGVLARLDRFTEVQGTDVTVRGRLLTVDAFSFTESAKGFPKMLASVKATAYLLPAAQGLTAGASPLAPAAIPAPATPIAAP